MKKLTLLIVFFGLLESAQCQFRIGPQVGVAFPRMNMEINNTPWKSNMRLGFQAGGIVEIPLNRSRDFCIQPGLLFSNKGQSYPVFSSKTINSLYYIEIPINLKFTKSIGMMDYGVFGGPYFAAGIAGKVTENKSDGKEMSHEVVFGNDAINDFSRLDAGLNLGLCMEISNFYYALQYGVGLIDIAPQKNNFSQNRVISLSLAYLFKVK